MSPFAVKMLTVLGLLCVLVQHTTATREYVWGKPEVNESVFVGTRQLLAIPFIKRKADISYPEEFYVGMNLSFVIHGIEIYEIPDEDSCALNTDIIGGIGASFAKLKLKSGRNCGIYVRVTFRVHRDPSKNLTKIPDQAITDNKVDEEPIKIPDQAFTGEQVDEGSTQIPDEAVIDEQVDGINDDQ